MTVPSRKPLTDALKSMLETATTRPVGVLRAPIINGEAAQLPYVVIFPDKGGRFMGPPLTAPNADAAFPYMIKCVGGREDQTELLADRVRTAILGRESDGSFSTGLTPTGLTVMDRQPGLDSTGELRQTGKISEIDDFYIIVVTTS